MRYRHPDGPDAAARMRLPGTEVSIAAVDEEGVYDAGEDVPDELHERLVELGHEPLEEDGDDADEASADEGNADDILDSLRASSFTEDELVEMSRSELRPIAANYEDINGNWSGEKLTEELIKRRREEVEE